MAAARAPAVYAEDTLREVANRFAVTGLDRTAVVSRDDPARSIGEITLRDLLEARLRDHREEHHRERLLWPSPARRFSNGQRSRRARSGHLAGESVGGRTPCA